MALLYLRTTDFQNYIVCALPMARNISQPKTASGIVNQELDV